MGQHYLLDDGEPDDGMIRRWAYDPDAELMEQDEDLVLHDWAFANVIFDAVADPHCPKREYLMGIWEDFTRHVTVHQNAPDLAAARNAVAMASNYEDSLIQRWVSDQNFRLKLLEGHGPVTRDQALSIGDALLNGASRHCTISVLTETPTCFIVQLSVPHGAHREWILVDRDSGRIRYSRYWPQGAAEPNWYEPN